MAERWLSFPNKPVTKKEVIENVSLKSDVAAAPNAVFVWLIILYISEEKKVNVKPP